VLLPVNGMLAGLVSITGCCDAVDVHTSVLIGIVGGLVMLCASRVLERFQIDDAVGAVPVHACAGVWGTVAVALFADLNTGKSVIAQLGVQLLGAGTCFVWAFGVGFVMLSVINRFFPLRVSDEQEQIGLNVAEHGARTELLDLVTVMHEQAETGNTSLRAPVEPFTEVGHIADQYNRVMEALAGRERLSALEVEVGQSLNQPGDAAAMLQHISEMLVDKLALKLARLWTLDESDETLELQASAGIHTHLDGEHSRITLGEQFIGQIASQRSEYTTNDATSVSRILDMNWVKRENIIGAAGFPLICDDSLVGAFAVFGSRPLTEDTLQALRTLADGIAMTVDRKRTEQALAESEKRARAADVAKSRFLANMSHEIRTPLNGIIGMTELTLDTSVTEQQREYLQLVKSSADSLLTVLNDVLDFSKSKPERLNWSIFRFDCAMLWEKHCRRSLPRYTRKESSWPAGWKRPFPTTCPVRQQG